MIYLNTYIIIFYILIGRVFLFLIDSVLQSSIHLFICINLTHSFFHIRCLLCFLHQFLSIKVVFKKEKKWYFFQWQYCLFFLSNLLNYWINNMLILIKSTLLKKKESIHTAYCSLIEKAKHFIYIEVN